MNNGQVVSMASAPTIVPQELMASVTMPTGGVQQNGDNFAGVLSSIQLLAKGKNLPDSGQVDKLMVTPDIQPLILDAGAEDPAVGLMAQLRAAQQTVLSSGVVTPNPENPEKADINAEEVAPQKDLLSEITAQMLLSVYSQPGRMPEVNQLTPLPVDRPQNVAKATAQPAVITAPAVNIQPEAAVAEASVAAEVVLSTSAERITEPLKTAPLEPPTVAQTVAQSDAEPTVIRTTPAPVQPEAPAVQAEAKPATAGVNILTPHHVDRPQNVAKATAQPAGITAPAVNIQQEAAVAEAPVAADVVLTTSTMQIPAAERTTGTLNTAPLVPPTVVQAVAQPDAEPTVIRATPAPVQPDAAVAGASVAAEVVLTTSTVQTTSAYRTTEPLKTAPSVPPTVVQTVAHPDAEQTVVQATPAPVQPEAAAAQAEAKPATAGVNIPTPLPVNRPQNVANATAQPAVITAPAANIQTDAAVAEASVAAVLVDSRTVGLLQQAYGVRQKSLPGQQIETIRTSADKGIVKEIATSLQPVISESDSTSGPDVADSNNSDQGHAFGSPDNQTLTQQMQGQLSTEHQKLSSANSKPVSPEPVRQDIPGQEMQNAVQQLKERLLQHDVKPGSQQITLTLSPENLGELKMNLNLQGQKLSVEIITENRSVRDAIVLHTDALKESLSRQNITMESFDVTTGGKGSGGQGQNQNAWRELAKQQQQQQFWTPPRGYLNTAQTDLPAGQAAYQKQYGQTMLDIHY